MEIIKYFLSGSNLYGLSSGKTDGIMHVTVHSKGSEAIRFKPFFRESIENQYNWKFNRLMDP